MSHEGLIRQHWEEMANNRYFYRGMSAQDLFSDSPVLFDPAQNPLKPMAPLLLAYSELLLELIKKGLECNVQDFYVEPLEKILHWTIRDIKNSGIDFTTNYADAVSYAFNYAGSQVKHNFNLIANMMEAYEDHECFDAIEKEKFWNMTSERKRLLQAE